MSDATRLVVGGKPLVCQWDRKDFWFVIRRKVVFYVAKLLNVKIKLRETVFGWKVGDVNYEYEYGTDDELVVRAMKDTLSALGHK